MKYSVIWNSKAEQELAAVWLASTDRKAVNAAANFLDSQLARNPLALGESRTSSVHRIAFREPLGFEYQVIVMISV